MSHKEIKIRQPIPCLVAENGSGVFIFIDVFIAHIELLNLFFKIINTKKLKKWLYRKHRNVS